MPHRMSRSKLVFFYLVSTIIVIMAVSFLILAIQYDYNSGKPQSSTYQENHITVDPRTQAALESMARAFNKWER